MSNLPPVCKHDSPLNQRTLKHVPRPGHQNCQEQLTAQRPHVPSFTSHSPHVCVEKQPHSEALSSPHIAKPHLNVTKPWIRKPQCQLTTRRTVHLTPVCAPACNSHLLRLPPSVKPPTSTSPTPAHLRQLYTDLLAR